MYARSLDEINCIENVRFAQVDINMQRAQKRDASRSELFHFRKWVFPLGRSPSHDDWSSRPSSPSRAGFGEDVRADGTATNGNESRSPSPGSSGSNGNGERASVDEVEEMTVDEIINGKVSDRRGPWSAEW